MMRDDLLHDLIIVFTDLLREHYGFPRVARRN